jgi:tetratricopeptide (TPR) repeat protein
MYLQGRFDQVDTLLAQALTVLERAESWQEWIHATALHAVAVAQRGRYAEGVAEATRVVERATALKSLAGLGLSRNFLTLLYITGGDVLRALEQVRLVLEAATQSGDQLVHYGAVVYLAWAHVRQGDLEAAQRNLTEAQALGAAVGGPLLWTPWFTTLRAELALRHGHVQEALALAEQTADAAEAGGDLFTLGWARRVQGEAEAHLSPPRWEDAEAHLAASLSAFEQGDARLEAARTHVAWGRVVQARGNLEAACEHFQQAAAQFEASGLEQELSAVRALLSAVTVTHTHPEDARRP